MSASNVGSGTRMTRFGESTSAVATSDPACATEGRSDFALVCGIARGDRDALAGLYARYGASVYGLARRLCDPMKALEVTQQVFLDIWRSQNDLDPDRDSLGSHLLAQAHKHGIAALRADASRRAGEADVSAQELELSVLGIASTEEIPSPLADLPDAERLPIVLAYFGGYTYRQVAEVLAQPEQTIRIRIDTGLRLMRAEQGRLPHISGPAAGPGIHGISRAGGWRRGLALGLLLEGVLHVLAGLLEVALGLVGLALGFETVIAGSVSDRLFDFAFGLLRGVLGFVDRCHVVFLLSFGGKRPEVRAWVLWVEYRAVGIGLTNLRRLSGG